MGISLKPKSSNVTKEDILLLVDDYQIFRHYLGEFPINRKFKNPLYPDKHGSCVIRSYDGKLVMTDYGDSAWDGDCFNMVKCANNCDYDSALRIIDRDFGLGLFNGEYKAPVIQYKKPIIKDAQQCKIFTKYIESNPQGDEYLAQYSLTLEDMNFCDDTVVKYVNELVVNYKHEWVGKLGIEYKLKNWRKVYRPYANKDNKWRSNIPPTELHGRGRISNCRIGVLTKSVKEGAFINKYLLSNVEMVQYEDFKALSEEDKKRLKQSCDKLYISFDSDETGVKQCTRLTQELDCEYINPPKELLIHKVKDWTDMYVYYKSPTPIIEFWRNKGVI